MVEGRFMVLCQCVYIFQMILLGLSLVECFAKFIVNYHVVLSPFLLAEVMNLLLRVLENSFES